MAVVYRPKPRRAPETSPARERWESEANSKPRHGAEGGAAGLLTQQSFGVRRQRIQSKGVDATCCGLVQFEGSAFSYNPLTFSERPFPTGLSTGAVDLYDALSKRRLSDSGTSASTST